MGGGVVGGSPKVFGPSLPECASITMTTGASGESGDPLTPGGNRKHHLHFAHSTANHSRSTWFKQGADMLDG